ncbi:MAG: HDOD domain-containing protein [Pseudomonadota bacterium]
MRINSAMDNAVTTIDKLTDGVKDLIPLPKAYVRIQQLVNDPDSSLADITEVIVHDPGLTSRILRIANSAYMALATKVDTVSRAVQVLGLNQVHDLALAGAAVGSLVNLKSDVIDVADFWRRSVYAAVVGRAFAKRSAVSAPERAFVCGLLHDVGNLLLAYRMPDVYEELFQLAIQNDQTLSQVQLRELGFDYSDVGGALLEKWQLPDPIMEPVRHHTHRLTQSPVELIADSSIVHTAAVVARASLWREEGDEPVPEFHEVAVATVGVDDTLVTECMGEANEALVEAMSLLLPKSSKPRAKATAA